MLRKLGVCLGIVLALVVSSSYPIVMAQDGRQATTEYQLNMRTGAGTNYDVVIILDPGVGLFLEARNADTSWVLARTLDGSARGWLASLYLQYEPGISAVNLPVSEEVVGGAAAPPAQDSAEAAPAAEEAPAAGPPSVTGEVAAYTGYQLNARSGPGTQYNVLATVEGNVGLVLEARNQDGSWVLARTVDGSIRGWLASLYIQFVNITAMSLPVSSEVVSGGQNNVSAGPSTEERVHVTYDGVNMAGYDPARIQDINLMDIPIVGDATGRAQEIFKDGQEKGNNRNFVSKVGDCSTEHWFFLKPFAWGQYNLGSHAYLQEVIAHFSSSLDAEGLASHNGYNVNTVQAPDWANPAYCQTGESPLLCEYRVNRPAAAIIMFGTSDLIVMTPFEFDFYYRHIIEQTIDRGIIPILSTFPGNQAFPNKTLIYNQIVVRIAYDYDLPLINLWRALEELPNEGLEPDGFHLGVPLDEPGNLAGPNLQTGYPTRNLVTLETLDRVWRSAMQ